MSSATNMIQRCAQCSQAMPDAAKFCPRCGAPTAGDLIRSATRLTPLMQQWRKLSTRLTRREAKQLLGEPARIDLAHATAPAMETWTYEYENVSLPNARVAGLVRVCAGEGRVLSWVEPDWTALSPFEKGTVGLV